MTAKKTDRCAVTLHALLRVGALRSLDIVLSLFLLLMLLLLLLLLLLILFLILLFHHHCPLTVVVVLLLLILDTVAVRSPKTAP